MATKFITVSIEIMHDKNLTPNQKFILSEIEQLSQLDKGCIASNKHFSELVGIKIAAVSNAINDLSKKGYISIDNTNTKRNYGRVITIHSNVDPLHSNVDPLHSNVESKENKTINKTINKVATSKPVATTPSFSLEDMSLAEKFYNNLLTLNPSHKKPKLETWAKDFRLMRTADNRSNEGINNFLDSLQNDIEWNFWRGNILSPKKMRENYDKVVTQHRARNIQKP